MFVATFFPFVRFVAPFKQPELFTSRFKFTMTLQAHRNLAVRFMLKAPVVEQALSYPTSYAVSMRYWGMKSKKNPRRAWRHSCRPRLGPHVGPGGVICLARQMLPITKTANAIPISLL